MNYDEALKEFLLDNEFRNNSKKTLENYRSMIQYFFNYTDSALETLSLSDIKRYTKYLREERADGKFLSDETVATYLRQLKVFLKFCESNHLIASGIANFQIPRTKKVNIRVLSNEELLLIFNLFQGNDFCDIRNRLIVSLLIDLGLRRVEIYRLKVSDNYPDEIVVDGKGSKERTLKKSEFVKDLMKKYLKIRNVYNVKDSDYMFLTHEGDHISYYFMSRLVEIIKKRTGIDRLYLHLFRHTFATHYLVNGGESLKLQVILGHESLEMVRKYVHLANQLKLDNSTSYIDNFLSKEV